MAKGVASKSASVVSGGASVGPAVPKATWKQQLPVGGVVVGVWATLPRFMGPKLAGLETSKEMVDHLIPGLLFRSLRGLHCRSHSVQESTSEASPRRGLATPMLLPTGKNGDGVTCLAVRFFDSHTCTRGAMSRSGYRDAHREGVLSIAKLAAGQESYYLDAVADGVEDYYVGSGEAPGQWMGAGAELLGLAGEVDGDDLHAVLAGTDPHSGERLVGRGRKLPGYDLTLSAPKSLSLLWAFGGEEVAAKVTAAHDAAMSATFGYLERNCCQVRLGHGGATPAAGGGLVMAAFRHRVSRAGDPQVHTHMLVANLAQGPDGKWRALDGRPLYRLKLTAGFVYQAHLRWEVCRALGVQWKAVAKGLAEMVGIPQRVLRVFSQRRVEIEAAMAEAGTSSAAAAEVAALATRPSKDRSVTVAELRRGWQDRAAMVGFDPDRIVDMVCGRVEVERPRLPSIPGVLDGLTAERSSFDRPAVIRAVAEGSPHGAPVASVERHADRVLVDDDVVPLAGGLQFSTTEQLEIEEHLLAGAIARREEDVAKVPRDVIRSVLAARPQLSAEQRRMVRAICGDGAGVSVVVGHAGSGKTTALEAARAAWSASGMQVTGCALARRAAGELEWGSAIPSFSISQVVGELDRGTWSMPRGSVLVVDEAGMVGTRALYRLAIEAQRTTSKLVLVGDPAQLPEIQAGGGFAALADSLGAVELTTNQRQNDRIDRHVVSALRDGRVEDAVGAMRRNGRLVTADTPDDLRTAMVGDWAEATSAGHDALMLAVRRVDVEILNRAARAVLRDAGKLGPDAFVVDGRGFAIGDRVLTLRNNARLRIWNGSRATVTAIDKTSHAVTVRLDRSDRLVSLPGPYVDRGWVTHAYASTIHKAQGQTVDKALLWGDRHVFAEAGYTALTRGRDANRFYVVGAETDAEGCSPQQHTEKPREDLARTLATSRAKTMALTADPDATEVARLVPLGTRTLRTERQDLIRRHNSGRGDPNDAANLRVLTKALDVHTRRLADTLRHDPPPQWQEALGDRPDTPQARAQWDAAIDSSAQHLVLHGNDRSRDFEGIEALLGQRPAGEAATRSWDHAASQILRAAEMSVGRGNALRHDSGIEV